MEELKVGGVEAVEVATASATLMFESKTDMSETLTVTNQDAGHDQLEAEGSSAVPTAPTIPETAIEVDKGDESGTDYATNNQAAALAEKPMDIQHLENSLEGINAEELILAIMPGYNSISFSEKEAIGSGVELLLKT
ncbi:UNVERIFIED_CONTAM: hypothetical protein HDU68_011735, partial [Siphonaria sp. JEL0065]